MVDILNEKKKKIDRQIEKKLLQKKLLIAQEKKKRALKFTNIGRMAYLANIDQLDDNVLLGAFLEISKNATQEKVSQWKKIAEDFSKSNIGQVFSISFLNEPSKEIKQKLKENKFIWNRFRKEYYGRMQKEDLENLLKEYTVKIQEINN